jgi:heme-degrading monooxygenase HmoA
MILEQAQLDVRPGEELEFESTFATAKHIISASPGFLSLRLSRCVEEPSKYLLLVEWESLESHTEGFRGSPAFQEWRRLLHHYYDPAPTVLHFEEVNAVLASAT